MKLSWTQSVCNECWVDRMGDRPPVRAPEPEPELCAWCAREHRSGIYLRADPDTVPYPTYDDDCS